MYFLSGFVMVVGYQKGTTLEGLGIPLSWIKSKISARSCSLVLFNEVISCEYSWHILLLKTE